MRTRVLSITAAFVLTSMPASAQIQGLPSAEVLRPAGKATVGQIDFGGRFMGVTGDEARFQRYRDLRDGVFVDIPIYHRETDTWWTTMMVKNAGYRDQRYSLSASRPGKITFHFLYDQTPTFISRDTLTPYTVRPADNGFFDSFGGTFPLLDAVQTRIQLDPTRARQEIENLATRFPSRLRRDTLGFDVKFNFNEHWQTKVRYQNTAKQGSIPWGASFGFNLPIEIPLPIDTRTNDFGASAEWTNQRGMFRFGYDGSWFDQKMPVYVWDNPLRITDRTYGSAYATGDGTSQGRGTEWPSNSLYYFNVAGAYRLRTRTSVNGTLSLGRSHQNEPLVPYTINTAIAPLNNLSSLDRATAQAKADLGAATLNVVTRPLQNFNVTARYRLARYDNKTPQFARTEYVRLDQVRVEGGPPSFQGYTRNHFDVDAAYTGIRYTAFRLGYGYYGADYAERVYFKSNDNTFRASVDTVGNQYASFRSLYEHAQRRGSGFHSAALEEVGEQPGLRHYDVANRDRDRFMIVGNFNPTAAVGVNTTIAWTKDTFLNPEQSAQDTFGLLNYKSQTYGIGLDYLPGSSIGVGASYNYDKYDGLSQSRNASPGAQFDDPRRNWTTSEDQKGHSVLGYLDLLKLVKNTEIHLSYNYSKYNGMYLYTTGSGYSPTPSAPGRVAQLPGLTSEENRLAADFRYFMSRNVAVGFAYWYDDYKVSDFALGPPAETFVSGIARPPIDESQPADSRINGIVLNYLYRPYTSHTAWVRLTYLW